VRSPILRQLRTVEALERREVPSSTVPANTLATLVGDVTSPGMVAEVSVPISARNINGRIPIVIGTATSPAEGSGLVPRVVSARGPDGRALPVQAGAPFRAGVHDEATAFVQDGTPGNLTIRVTGSQGSTGAFEVRVYLPGDIDGDGQVTFSDLQAISGSYGTRKGGPHYDVAADTNLNDQIGQEDARALVRNLRPVTPRGPLQVKLTLAPRDAVRGHVPSTSGGHTYHKVVTILGRTTPGSIVFEDSGLGDFSFSGRAIPTDPRGNFSLQVTNVDGINNNNFLVVDPYGKQQVRAFPIYYFNAVYQKG
jgi:hypothetical protein